MLAAGESPAVMKLSEQGRRMDEVAPAGRRPGYERLQHCGFVSLCGLGAADNVDM